ncbi:MAG: hypothetical protein KDB01_03635 [Planctomycetaceae bacterium]|nr:hypothetical protein [Planctomycetaceae bacterium]
MSTTSVDPQHTCLLISSCDAYSDAWAPFFTLLNRYWPDCPFQTYLISNKQTVNVKGVHCIPTGQDAKWASNMLQALDVLPHAQILYFQEDYFLQKPVNNATIFRMLQFAHDSGAGYIRLTGAPDPDVPHDNPLGLGLLSPDLKFRVSLQASLWQRQTLLDLLVPGESGWDMEIAGTVRARQFKAPFFGVHRRKPIIDYYEATGILKGKWVPGALRLCRREGIEVDTSQREIHGEWPFIVKRFRNTPVVKACRTWFKRMRGKAA